jgi:hypothetical protein
MLAVTFMLAAQLRDLVSPQELQKAAVLTSKFSQLAARQRELAEDKPATVTRIS